MSTNWSLDDVKVLLIRIPMGQPESGKRTPPVAVYRNLDWEKVKFGTFTAEDCKKKFYESRSQLLRRIPVEWELDLLRKVFDLNSRFLAPPPSKAAKRHGFAQFVHDEMPKIRLERGENNESLMGRLGANWKQMTSEEQQVYKDEAMLVNDAVRLQQTPKLSDLTAVEPPELPQSACDDYIEAKRDELNADISERKLRKKLTKRFNRLDAVESYKWKRSAQRRAKRFLVELKRFAPLHPKLAVVIPTVDDLVDGTVESVVIPPPQPIPKTFHHFARAKIYERNGRQLNLSNADRLTWLNERWAQLHPDDLAELTAEYDQAVNDYNLQVPKYFQAIADVKFKAEEEERLALIPTKRKGKRP